MAGKKTAVVLRVVAKTESFRRGGFTFTRDQKDIPMEQFDGKEGQARLKLIKEESMLFCTEVEIEIPDTAENASKEKK
jgi:hypothetical protein